jgi:hypothetical protein
MHGKIRVRLCNVYCFKSMDVHFKGMRGTYSSFVSFKF